MNDLNSGVPLFIGLIDEAAARLSQKVKGKVVSRGWGSEDGVGPDSLFYYVSEHETGFYRFINPFGRLHLTFAAKDNIMQYHASTSVAKEIMEKISLERDILRRFNVERLENINLNLF